MTELIIMTALIAALMGNHLKKIPDRWNPSIVGLTTIGIPVENSINREACGTNAGGRR